MSNLDLSKGSWMDLFTLVWTASSVFGSFPVSSANSIPSTAFFTQSTYNCLAVCQSFSLQNPFQPDNIHCQLLQMATTNVSSASGALFNCFDHPRHALHFLSSKPRRVFSNFARFSCKSCGSYRRMPTFVCCQTTAKVIRSSSTLLNFVVC